MPEKLINLTFKFFYIKPEYELCFGVENQKKPVVQAYFLI